ncbi:hypothetical protein A0256_06305 [Mucilaginibacter sp. PAMC 26640]|nr:hypothetical protein A0256_06305 [Mucilaginibacter sp. PAMC 26640]
MKKRLLIKNLAIILGLLAMVSFSSCLKDKNFVDFAAVGTTIDIPLGGLSGVSSLTENKDTIVRQFAVNVSSPKPLTTDLTVSLGVDQANIDAYNKLQTAVVYEAFPAGSYVMDKTSVVIPANTRTQIITVTFYKNKLDPAKSYLLPIAIKDAQGQVISGNFGIKYYNAIGNDFAGPYDHAFTRTPAAGNYGFGEGHTAVFIPNTPRQFEVAGGYFTGTIRYRVSFTKTGTGAGATYSQFSIVVNPDDVKDILAVQSTPISVTVPAFIVDYVEKQYTFTEALALFKGGFSYSVFGSAARTNLDQYQK